MQSHSNTRFKSMNRTLKVNDSENKKDTTSPLQLTKRPKPPPLAALSPFSTAPSPPFTKELSCPRINLLACVPDSSSLDSSSLHSSFPMENHLPIRSSIGFPTDPFIVSTPLSLPASGLGLLRSSAFTQRMSSQTNKNKRVTRSQSVDSLPCFFSSQQRLLTSESSSMQRNEPPISISFPLEIDERCQRNADKRPIRILPSMSLFCNPLLSIDVPPLEPSSTSEHFGHKKNFIESIDVGVLCSEIISQLSGDEAADRALLLKIAKESPERAYVILNTPLLRNYFLSQDFLINRRNLIAILHSNNKIAEIILETPALVKYLLTNDAKINSDKLFYYSAKNSELASLILTVPNLRKVFLGDQGAYNRDKLLYLATKYADVARLILTDDTLRSSLLIGCLEKDGMAQNTLSEIAEAHRNSNALFPSPTTSAYDLTETREIIRNTYRI